MRVLFICGSLEPGRDGVGDYTRRLCAMLKLQGCEVFAMAYCDKHIKEEFRGYQHSEGEDMEVIRLPSKWSNNRRLNLAREWVNKKDPEWLSLQFVPYSYQSKGLPFGLGAALSKLGESRQWHVMFHELWIGMEQQSSYKHWMIGKLQRKIIRDLLNILKPDIIHTQTRLYSSLLSENGYASELLPLFSNIPFIAVPPTAKDLRDDSFMLVLFGHINPGAPVKEFSEEVRDHMQRKGLKPRLVLLGRNGAGQTQWINAFQKVGIPVQVLGEQDFTVISQVLQLARVGVTTTPRYLLEKSGTVAALRLHGLPVIGVAKPWIPRHNIEVDNPPAYFEFKPGALQEFQLDGTINSDNNTVWAVAKHLLTSLTGDVIIEKKNPLITSRESIDFIS